MNQEMYIVLPAKGVFPGRSVFEQPSADIIGDTDVENGFRIIRQNVDIIGMHNYVEVKKGIILHDFLGPSVAALPQDDMCFAKNMGPSVSRKAASLRMTSATP
jgi:hypothetical protein